MSSYQRARRPEQKHERREAILAAARALASERSVREVSLGDIARGVELAKSNVLRYFQSREEIFLTLLAREWTDWNAEVSAQLGDDVPAALAGTLAARPLFCDLLSEHAAVLERNVSAETVRTFRAETIALVNALGDDLAVATGLNSHDGRELVAATLIISSGLWPLATPAPHVAAMLAEGDELLDPDFERRLRTLVGTLIAGFSAQQAV
jgi:AcrR family transcriptional regulator